MRLHHMVTLLLITFALGSGAAQGKPVQLEHEGLTVNAELVTADGSDLHASASPRGPEPASEAVMGCEAPY